MQEHASGINVAHLQLEGFTQTQAAGIDRSQSNAMVDELHLAEDATHLGGREDDGQFELRGGAGELDLGGPGPLKGFLPEELEGAQSLGGGLAGELLGGLEMEEILAEIFGREEVGGPIEVFAQLADAGPVAALGAGLEGQKAQVIGEAVQDCVWGGLFLCMAVLINRCSVWCPVRPVCRPDAAQHAGWSGSMKSPNATSVCDRAAGRSTAAPPPPRSGFVQPAGCTERRDCVSVDNRTPLARRA